MKYIICDTTKSVLMIANNQKDCEFNLAYFLNHGHDAYLTDSIDGYKVDEFTLVL